jgi:hypothetical protein
MNQKCYLVVENYEDVVKVFLSQNKAEKFAQELRARRESEGEDKSLLENRVSIQETDFEAL